MTLCQNACDPTCIPPTVAARLRPLPAIAFSLSVKGTAE